MFGIDGPEFLVILVVLIIVIGPKDLPKMMRAFGKTMARMRATANEFRQQFDDALREAELDDIKNTIKDVADLDPRKKLTKVFDPIRDVAKDVRTTLSVEQTKIETPNQTSQIKKTTIDQKIITNDSHHADDYVGFDSPVDELKTQSNTAKTHVDTPKTQAQILREKAKLRRKARAMKSTPGGFVAIKRSGVYGQKAEKVIAKRKRNKRDAKK